MNAIYDSTNVADTETKAEFCLSLQKITKSPEAKTSFSSEEIGMLSRVHQENRLTVFSENFYLVSAV